MSSSSSPPKWPRNTRTEGQTGSLRLSHAIGVLVAVSEVGGCQEVNPGEPELTLHALHVLQGALIFPLSALVPHVLKLLGGVPNLPDFSAGIAGADAANDSRDACFNLLGHDRDSNTFMDFCEDVELLEGATFRGHSLFSCDSNRGNWNTVMGPLKDPSPRGHLWIWNHARVKDGDGDMTSNNSLPVRLALEGYPSPRTFHPLGTRFDPATNRLFVVNHAEEASAIEAFQLANNDDGTPRATHLFTLRDPLATHTPNAIVALPGNRLLITQDHFIAKRSPGVAQLTRTYTALLGKPWLAQLLAFFLDVKFIADLASRLETLLGIRGGFVTLVEWSESDGSAATQPAVTSRVVLSRIAFPNGIALSRTRKTLAVASTMSHSVRLYQLGEGGVPVNDVPPETIPLDFLPDNIAFASDDGHDADADAASADPLEGGALIVTGHPAPLKLLSIAKDPYRSMAMSVRGQRRDGSVFTYAAVSPDRTKVWQRVAPGRSVMVSRRRQRQGRTEHLRGEIAGPSPAWVYREVYSGQGSLEVPVSQDAQSKIPSTSSNLDHAKDQSKYWKFPDLHGTTRELGLDTTSAAVVDQRAGISIIVGLYAREVMVCKLGRESESHG